MCSTLTSCTSCNAEDLCIWSSGTCNNNPSGIKSITDYETCKDLILSERYCTNFISGISDFPSSIAKLSHQPYGGTIIPGVYCEWIYILNPKYPYKMTAERPQDTAQVINIFLQGTRGENATINNSDFSRSFSAFTIYNAATITISTVQKISGSKSVYE